MSVNEPAPATAGRGSRVAWKPALIVFVVGAVAWAVQFAWAWLLYRRGAQWYPGLELPGGEWRGWQGLGWMTEQSYCFGTQEMCANYVSSPKFHVQPVGILIFFGILAAVSLVIGLAAATGRRQGRR